jgi:hypothetical protein
MKRFLGLTEEEIAENERLWREENDENLEPAPSDAAGEMRGAGISGAGIEGDLGGMEDIADDTPIDDGGEGTAPETQTDQQLGGTPGNQTPGTDQTI